MGSDTWSVKNIATEEIYLVSKPIFKVGRSINADITSLTSSLSRNHATLLLIDGLLYVQDNNSCNGTFVNNEKIELKLLNDGDVVGFGCSQQLCEQQKFEIPPLIFTVLKNNNTKSENVCKQAPEEQLKNISEFSDCIIISDDEDDVDLFKNSQIYKISEKIKTEQTPNEHDDPYYNIKQELEDLDCCDNQYVIELSDEETCFDNTSDLVDLLESPTEKCINTNVDKEYINNLLANKKNRGPPIIEPHVDTGSKRGKKDTKKNLADIKSTSKRKCTVASSHVRKRSKSTNNIINLELNKKLTEEECNKARSTSKSPIDKNKHTCENQNQQKEFKGKSNYKNQSDNHENRHNNTEKNSKNIVKVKNSVSRGTFLVDEVSRENMRKKHKENRKSLPSENRKSFPSTSKSTLEKIKIHSEDKRIQDTTITSNCSPKIEHVKQSNITKPLNNVKCDFQGPDTTFSDNRSGIIWKTASNFVRPNKIVYRNITIDDSISKIVHWSVKWLMEQNNIDISPPVNGQIRPKAMPLYFTNFSEYSDTVTSLAMLELWQYIYQMLYNSDEERSPIRIFLNHKRIVGNLTYLDCECYMSEENVKNNTLPRMDDFGMIELKLKDSENCYSYTGFAYIKFFKRIALKENCPINNSVAALCSGHPNVHLKFSIITRNLATKDIVGKQIILKVVANISTSLRLLKGIKCLETSSLSKNILCPKVEDFKVSSRDQNLIVEVNLNNEQKKIVLEASNLCSGNIPKLYLIKGPPGTGKSTVIINIVLQIVLNSIKNNSKDTPLILLTAPSNTAVDGLILKLAEIRKKLSETQKRYLRMVRLGPENSISKQVDGFKLSSLARNNILKEHRLTSSEKYKEVLEKGASSDEFLRNHFGHNYYYEMKCAEDVLLLGCNIICTTLNSSVSPRILEARRRDQLKFSCCIIDEATQCCEPESLLPIQLGIDKIVLVGDPKQLPAVVCNKGAKNLGYGKSLFARIAENFEPLQDSVDNPVRVLYEQYRMKREICEYPNKAFYDGTLRSFPIHTNKITPELKPYLLFNLNSGYEDESLYINSQEVGLIYSLLGTLKKCIQSNCKYTIGIITPYRAQKDLILNQISGIKFNVNVSITVNTVDSFQGMENDIVVISCVRNAPNNFLQNEQRLNVALTRARQALYIIGNYLLFKHCQPLYDLREDAKKRRLCIDIKETFKNVDFSKYILKV